MTVLSKAQIYRGIQGLNRYRTELDSLDGFLKSNPKEFKRLFDELETVQMANKDKTLKAILHVFQGSFHYYSNRMNAASVSFDKAMAVSREIGNDQIFRTAKIRKIFTDEYKKTKYQMAKEMEEIYVDSYNKRDTINMLYSLNGLGIFYGDMDSVSLSLKIFYEALQLADRSENMYEKGFILNNLGLIKYDLGALDSAYSDFSQCLKIGLKYKNVSLEGIARQNLGLYYMRIDSVGKAREEYHKVLKIGREFGYTLYELSSMTNLATLEMSEGNAEASDSLGEMALKIAKEGGILYSVANIYLGRTYYKMQTNKYDEALQMLDSVLAYAEYAPYSEVMPPYYHLRYRVYEEKGDYKKAFEYYKEKVAVDDSLDKIGDSKLLAELQFRYDDEKKERIRSIEENKLKLQIKQGEVDMATFRQKVIILIAVFLAIIFLIVILYFKLKQKSDNLFSYTIANKLEEERGRIARDLHDGLGQSLIILKNKFHHLKVSDDKSIQQLDDNFSEVIEEVRSISRSLIPPELRRLGLKQAIVSMMEDIEKSTGMIVTTELDVLSDFKFEEHQSIRIYRIIQELCTNSVKHSGATSIKLEAIKGEEGNLLFVFQDNGSGLDLEKWKSARNSVGFKSIQQRLKYLNGSIKVEKPKTGFKVEVNIPAAL
ncbi:MAG: hypothetical protein HUJ25_08370 [Crocinitomicaceae bacterium]|nr:hypothetical protein [Crocinitomicaceae bacterium]